MNLYLHTLMVQQKRTKNDYKTKLKVIENFIFSSPGVIGGRLAKFIRLESRRNNTFFFKLNLGSFAAFFVFLRAGQ